MRDHPEWCDVTRGRYLSWLLRFECYLNSRSLTWTLAQRRHLEDFQQQLLWTANGRGGLQSANTIYQAFRLLRTFYRWAVERDHLSQNPMQDWLLPRPPSRPRALLSWEQTCALFRRPDLGKPGGHRDLLLLHLIYHGLSVTSCHQLELDSELPSDATLRAIGKRYVDVERPRLVRTLQHQQLLVTDRGTPYKVPECLGCRLKKCYGVNALLLRESHRAHRAEIDRRTGPIY